MGEVTLPIGSEKRAAVIFANQNYVNDVYDLKKTYNDADDIKATLEKLGFTVIVFKKDLTRVALDRAILGLENQLKGYGVVFFYYTGHGAEYNGENFFIPTDIIPFEYNSDVKTYGISLNNVYEALEKAKVATKIIVTDACRNLPMGKGNVTNSPIIPKEAPVGTFTMFATRSGRIAKENLDGRNSYFTQELLKNLVIPNLDINEIYYRTKLGVQQATKQSQEPSVLDELTGKFKFLIQELPDPNEETKKRLAQLEEENRKLKEETNKKAPPSGRSDGPGQGGLDLPSFMDMVKVVGGSFKREGYDITVSSFMMGKYEVTVGQFAQFVTETNYKTDAEKGDGSYIYNNGNWTQKAGINWRHDEEGKVRPSGQYNHPVVHVSHNDAVAFCEWLSRKEGKVYRLPTEAEWEYAAGGGGNTRTTWAGTNNESTLATFGNFCDVNCTESWKDKNQNDGYKYSSPVGVFWANGLGLHDMSGNVWEWCSDWYGDYPKLSQTNPTGPATATFRVLRGGSWNRSPNYARVAYRYFSTPDNRNLNYGFRLVSQSQ